MASYLALTGLNVRNIQFCLKQFSSGLENRYYCFTKACFLLETTITIARTVSIRIVSGKEILPNESSNIPPIIPPPAIAAFQTVVFMDIAVSTFFLLLIELAQFVIK